MRLTLRTFPKRVDGSPARLALRPTPLRVEWSLLQAPVWAVWLPERAVKLPTWASPRVNSITGRPTVLRAVCSILT
jgi:hypothetical protein